MGESVHVPVPLFVNATLSSPTILPIIRPFPLPPGANVFTTPDRFPPGVMLLKIKRTDVVLLLVTLIVELISGSVPKIIALAKIVSSLVTVLLTVIAPPSFSVRLLPCIL